ncbi:uncharacterized protein LOC134824562 [Bolinopsis microptera]|uniref:uncharacterized protein LOC134824562 n=1 Tax=Bolinopsis microptera TaxID=2820187 RepID=UPI0030795795
MRFIILGLVCFAVLAATADQDLRQTFKDWKVTFNKNYGGGLRNELARFRQFKKSAQTIEYINSIQSDWVAGFTLFADMTDEEKAAFTGLKLNDTASEPSVEYGQNPLDPTDPEKQYWDMGPVKNQWKDNPYKGNDRECTELKTPHSNGLRRAKPYAHLARYGTRNDAGLQHALATEGPVVVYIYSSWALPFYTTGTYRGTGCGTNPQYNHAVVAAGYEKDYWYVKNSWGSLWGYSGYVYFSRGWENLCSISSSRKTIEWRANNEWKICTDTHPSERTPCDSSANLNQEVCQARGCCYDSNYAGTAAQCFIKGKVTIYDDEGKRRVLYASAEEFSQFEFSYYGKAAQVEIGSWKLFVEDDYYGDYKIIKPEDGKVTFDFQSVQILN